MARSFPSRRFPLACLAVLLGGCVPSSFTPAFDRAARLPADPRQPIVGAWQGEWVSADGGAAGPARLVVTAAPAGTGGAGSSGAAADSFTMELVGFPQADVDERFAAQAVVDPADGPVRDFAAKVPAVVSPDTGICVLALGLQAHADGDAMHVSYWVNDALKQVDAGQIDLRRAKPTAAERAGE